MHVNFYWFHIWLTNPFLGALPSYKISWQSEFSAKIDNDLGFWLQTLSEGVYNLGFERSLTSKFFMWCSTPL